MIPPTLMTSRMLLSKLVRNQTTLSESSDQPHFSGAFQQRHGPALQGLGLHQLHIQEIRGSHPERDPISQRSLVPLSEIEEYLSGASSLLIFFELFLSIIGLSVPALEMRIIYLFSPVIIFSHWELSFNIICSNISVHLHYVKIYISVRFTLKLYNSQHFLLLWFMLKPNRSALLCFAIKLSRLYRNERDFILHTSSR